jgi:hypothetical protein
MERARGVEAKVSSLGKHITTAHAALFAIDMVTRNLVSTLSRADHSTTEIVTDSRVGLIAIRDREQWTLPIVTSIKRQAHRDEEAGGRVILIHDFALGPIDFSGPRCSFLIRSSGFHEPALARQRVYVRLRALEYLLFRLDSEALSIRTRTSTFIFKVLNLVSGLKRYVKLRVIRV